MSSRDLYQASRREMKYIVSESAAQAIREMVSAHLDPDPHTVSAGQQGYYLKSLYLDGEMLTLYRQTRRGEKNRFKLRIRFYNDSREAPAFLEVKRRTTEAITKERAAVTKRAAERFLAGIRLTADDLLKPNAKTTRSLKIFCDLCERVSSRGIVFVGYRRQAFMTAGSNRVRVTFDRELSAYRYEPRKGLRADSPPCPVNMEGVILEFKFTDRFPNWMHEIAQLFPRNAPCRSISYASRPSSRQKPYVNRGKVRWRDGRMVGHLPQKASVVHPEVADLLRGVSWDEARRHPPAGFHQHPETRRARSPT